MNTSAASALLPSNTENKLEQRLRDSRNAFPLTNKQKARHSKQFSIALGLVKLSKLLLQLLLALHPGLLVKHLSQW